MAGKNQITGGAFQDFEGNVLAYGHLTMQLSHDGQESVDPGQVVGGLPIVIPLDGQGNIAGTVLIWPNDQLVPANSFYIVNAFRRDGQIAWLSPQNFAIPSAPSPYNIGTAIPTLPPVPGIAGGGVTLQTNEVNNGSQTLLDLHAGANITLTDNGVGRVTVAASGGSTLPSAQTGDTLRFNEYGDGVYDACIAVPRFVSVVGEPANAAVTVIGSAAAAASTTGTITNIAATSTESYLKRFTGTSSATTSVTAQMGWYSSGGVNFISLGTVKRLSIRCRLNQTTNCRYFVGWTAFWSSGAAMAVDNPNLHYACFRYSAGTDSTIKAVCGTATASQTVVDTLVSVDTTNSQLFDIVYTGSAFLFFINGVQTASINTNTPVAADLLNMQITSDNKNTANAISFDLDYTTVVFK